MLLFAFLLSSIAFASDYEGMSIEELEALRNQTYHELELINQEIAKKTESRESS